MIRAQREDNHMLSLRTKVLIGIALVVFLAGICGALVRGFWGVSQDCHEWVDSHGYQLVHDDRWAKSRGCVARTAAGDELYHSEEFRSKAIGWAWQFAIFAVGTVPAVTIVAIAAARRRRRSVGGNS
jgi:hypothetical protein